MSHCTSIENFRFSVLPNNVSGGVSIPLTLSPTPTILASLTLRFDCDFDFTLLTATVGWLAVTDGTDLERTNVLFKIWRGAPLTGCLVFSANDSGDSDSDSGKVTSLTHVDTGLKSLRGLAYFLTAESAGCRQYARVIGPITFTATEFER